MVNIKSVALCFVLLAVSSQLASASWLHDHLMKKVEAKQAAVSGVRESGVREQPATIMNKKDQMIKEMLGLAGPTTASQVPAGCRSAWELLQANSANFTFLINAIKATGLESVLSDPSFIGTVFAPDDAAFTATLIDLDLTPSQLFNDPVTLTIILKYHVIPGLSLQEDDFKDSQPYYTLLTDKKGNKYTVVYDWTKTVDLKAVKDDDEDTETVEYEEVLVPSGGDEAEIDTSDNLQPGCPTAVYVIDYVLLPAYKDAVFVAAADNALNAADAYQSAGGSLRQEAAQFQARYAAAP